MATLGDVDYRFPAVDEWTNLAFLLMVLAPLGFWSTWVIVPAAAMVCGGSWLWHMREAVLSRRFDELGMMMTLPAISTVLGARAAGSELVLLAAPLVWAFYYERLHRTSSFKHIAYWSAFILGQTISLADWWALVPLGLALFAFYGQFGLPWSDTRYEHGPRHGLLWHVPIALALYSVLDLTADASTIVVITSYL